VRSQPTKVPWDQLGIAAALSLVIDEQPWGRTKKRMVCKRLQKLAKRGQLTVDRLDQEWAYRLCAASLMQHNYHWYGWEVRSPWAHQMASTPWCYPQWDGSRCKLLVVAEQGLGDEIVFSTGYHELAEDVEEAWIEMEPRLIPIMERSMPENLHFINRYLHDRKMIVPRVADYPERWKEFPIEAFITAGNVPKLYRHNQVDFPKQKGFLKADPERTEYWKGQFVGVGCSWTGRQGDIPRLDSGVSLQYGKGVDHGSLLVPKLDFKWDVDDVFALIAALGEVYTTTNAVAHMAGALGVPTDVIKPKPIYAQEKNPFNNRVQSWWPYDKTDWYPSIKMWRSYEQWRHRK